MLRSEGVCRIADFRKEGGKIRQDVGSQNRNWGRFSSVCLRYFLCPPQRKYPKKRRPTTCPLKRVPCASSLGRAHQTGRPWPGCLVAVSFRHPDGPLLSHLRCSAASKVGNAGSPQSPPCQALLFNCHRVGTVQTSFLLPTNMP